MKTEIEQKDYCVKLLVKDKVVYKNDFIDFESVCEAINGLKKVGTDDQFKIEIYHKNKLLTTWIFLKK
jgi:hypothetical protein